MRVGLETSCRNPAGNCLQEPCRCSAWPAGAQQGLQGSCRGSARPAGTLQGLSIACRVPAGAQHGLQEWPAGTLQGLRMACRNPAGAQHGLQQPCSSLQAPSRACWLLQGSSEAQKLMGSCLPLRVRAGQMVSLV
jgi:hypothetical protein